MQANSFSAKIINSPLAHIGHSKEEKNGNYNKTEEDKENELQWKVSFVKKGMYTQRISQVDLQEMLKRGWITEQEFKNYG